MRWRKAWGKETFIFSCNKGNKGVFVDSPLKDGASWGVVCSDGEASISRGCPLSKDYGSGPSFPRKRSDLKKEIDIGIYGNEVRKDLNMAREAILL